MPKAPPQKKGPRKTQVASKPPQAQAGVQEPVFDYSPSAPYNMKLLPLVAIPRPPALTYHRPMSLDKRETKARKLYGPVIQNFNQTHLIYRSERSIESLKADRRAYLGVRNNTDKLGPFMDDIRKLFGQFSRSSPNPFSTRIISSDGETLVAAYQYAAPAHIVEANRDAHDSGKTMDVDEQPTSRKFANYKTQPFHGIKDYHRLDYHQATQTLMSIIPPEKPKATSRRHGGLDPKLQSSYYFVHRGLDGKGSPTGERCGTQHIVSCWPQTGRPHEPMTHSSVISTNALAPHALELWFQNTLETHVFLDMIFENEYPEKYKAHKKAHKTATWRKSDPGPYLGRVIVWKLQSTEHMDNGDDTPTATITLDEDHTGGIMQVLQVRSQFTYGAGTVIFGWTSYLWHKVTEWQPRPSTDPRLVPRKLTPGRIGVVNYIPQSSFAQLEGKDSSWGRRTLWGQLEEAPEGTRKGKGKRA